MTARRRTGGGWGRLLRSATAVEALALGSAAVVLTDVEAAAFAVAAIALLWLHVRRPEARPFVAALGLLALPVSFFGIAAALTNLPFSQHVAAVLQPAVMGGAGVAAVIAAAAVLLGRRGHRAPLAIAAAVGLWVVVALAVALNSAGAILEYRYADVVVVAEDVAFAPTELRASGDPIILFAENRDLFWHTVTIPDLGVDLRMPVGAVRYVAIDAQTGTYTFYCAVPGHRQVGMEGTLTVG